MDDLREERAKVFIMACAGGANVGLMSHRAAAELAEEGFARPFCLAGIGAHLKGFLKTASGSANIVIDGCAVACGKTILEHAAVPVSLHLVITDLGIPKKMTSDLSMDDVVRIKEAVRSRWAVGGQGMPGETSPVPGGSSCDCKG